MAISMQELSLYNNIGIHNPSLASFQSLSLGMRLETLTGAQSPKIQKLISGVGAVVNYSMFLESGVAFTDF